VTGATLELEPRSAGGQQPAVTRLGVVRYVNTRPLIAGLEALQGLRLRPEVPAQLIGTLERGETHAALCSSVDFQMSSLDLVVLPVGVIGCDGPTLTVQVFSRVPFEQVRRLHADADSHTSRVLAQVVAIERFGRAPELVDGLPALPGGEGAEAMLLIGDKALQQAPSERDFPHRIDLGAAWKQATGHAFTFACWMAPRPRTDAERLRLRTLSQVLDHQRRRNFMRRDALAALEARAHGWPADTARRYLCDLLRFEWNERQRAGLQLFWNKAAAAGLLRAPRPLALLEP
jgi:chorismate dehydratase